MLIYSVKLLEEQITSKTITKKDETFQIVTKKEFDKIPEDKKSVVAKTSLKEYTNQDKKNDKIKLKINKSEFVCEEGTSNYIEGYIYVGNNEYICLNKNILPIIILLLGVIAAISISFVAYEQLKPVPEPVYEQQEIADGEKWDGQLPINGKEQEASTESIEIPGYAELYANAENPNIQLVNPDLNTVYFKYIIYENEKIIHETDLIRPGEKLDWNAYNDLTAGQHQVNMVINTFDINTQAPCNGAKQNVSITIY